MADNYLQFSETLDNLTPEEATWLRHQLEPIAVIDGTEYPEDDDAVANSETEPSYRGLRFLQDYEELCDDADMQGFEIDFQQDGDHSYAWLSAEATAIPAAWPISSRSSSNSFAPTSSGRSLTPRPARSSAWASSAAGPCSSRLTRFTGKAVTSSSSNSVRRFNETEIQQRRQPNMAKRRQQSYDDFMAACNAVARERLLGRRIVEVRYLQPDECNRLMWGQTSVAIVLDNGTMVYAVRDAEGNDAGALHGLTKSGEQFVLPELTL